ncbi:MAG: restriction endonuclease [Butyrivibrio sp.]
MVINDKNNFKPMIVKLLNGLGYENVRENTGDSAIDITAEKDGEKYGFRCKYDIDAIGEKEMDAVVAVAGNYDKAVYVTNSSFISGAKKKGEANGILLWDRNTIDRMSIPMAEKIDDEVVKEKKSHTALIVTIILIVLIAAAVAYWYFFKR